MKWLSIGIILTSLLLVQARREEDGRIVAAFSTKTAYSITTSTTTVPLTCASSVNNVPCKKRRYRRYSNLSMMPLEPLDQDSLLLGASMADNSELLSRDERAVPSEDKGNNDREGRIAITVWTTTSSTFTVTSTSINSATTFSVSYYCVVTGAGQAPACG